MNYSKFANKFNPIDVFRMELTADQMHYLASLLPSGYSFHVEPRKKQMKISVPAPSKKKLPPAKEVLNNQSIEDSSSVMNYSKKQKLQQSKNASKKNQLPVPQQSSKNFTSTIVGNKTPSANKWMDELPENIKRCAKILMQLKSHKSSLPFLEAVDAVAMGIPEYYEIIKEPMDLSLIENNIKSNKYKEFADFQADVLKIIQNSYRFNQANEEFLKITSDFENFFNKIVIDPLASEKSKAIKKKKKTSSSNRQSVEMAPLTLMQKKQLAQQIRRLGKEHLKGIKKIVYERQEDEQEIFDLEKLSQKKMRDLQKYVRNKVIQMQDRNRNSNLEKNQNTNLDLFESDISSFESDSEREEKEQEKMVEAL